VSALIRHPASRCDAIDAASVEIDRPVITFEVRGRIGELLIPPPTAPERTDGLWRHTCFEAFVRAEGEGYEEFNFSPSGQWAAYDFSGYRAGMAPLDIPPPLIETEVSEDRLVVRVTLQQERRGRCRIGLAAVIEEKGGNISYWALNHPPGAPDFHHRDCFALDLPPAG
jgi:hypothetical protein